MERRILGINVGNRKDANEKVQTILTTFGCSIRTRLGLHETNDESNHPGGLILLELIGDVTEWDKLEKELSAIEHCEIQKMDFSTI